MSAAAWVENHLGHPLTDFQRSAVELICEAMRCGPYDFVGTFDRADWKWGNGVAFVIRRYLSSYDDDGLTRLVFGAHQRCIRVEIEGCGPKMLRVIMHPRDPQGDCQGRRHPRLEEAVEKYLCPGVLP